MEATNLVWLKRDLRTSDHAALHAAEEEGEAYRIICCFEPDLLSHPDTSLRHQQFVYQSILQMNQKLIPSGRQVQIFHGSAPEIFEYLTSKLKIHKVFSYQESGIEKSWQRDKAVQGVLKSKNIIWTEFQRDGIARGIRNRDGWDQQWYATMNRAVTQNSFTKSSQKPLEHPFAIPEIDRKILETVVGEYQPAGEEMAWKYLHSFTSGRGFNYQKHISKPTESRTSCARISPYLAWGNLSIRQVYQFVKQHANFKSNKRAFGAFLMRLKWHCHFIQKFESECSYEQSCVNRGYELLHHEADQKKLHAWKRGKTGYPMVDACMRCLAKTGWINFRMRAMLVSFLCHHLDQDWRSGVYHLARYFLDYEPGIHYPQFQMQAGTTGINTVRIYNPVKQGYDHDPKGEFVKQWIPELQPVSVEHIHEPWKMTAIEQSMCGVRIGKHYPQPIVDLKESGRMARKKIWGHRSHPLVKQDCERILKKHTRQA
jgi:deoxyribodipyrimidine photo-lyase